MYIYICIYVVHAPAYASSHQTLLRKSMLLQGCSNYCTMTDAARTEESATSASAKPWLSAHRALIASSTLAVCLSPTTAAAPWSVSVFRFLHCLCFLRTAAAARWMLLRSFCNLPTPTLGAIPQLKLNRLSFVQSRSLKSAPSARWI